MAISLEQFKTEFFALTGGWDWEVEGFVDKTGYVFPIDRDTKVISTVFERLSSPVIRSIVKPYNYKVETANQTTYPDFTLTDQDGHRIGVDIKTTYDSKNLVFTLGGYNSFIRNNTKNILYPYDTYNDHWIIGFIYTHGDPFVEYDLDEMPKIGDIGCPYSIKHIFIRRKFEISGLRAGSGNTKNIGSVKLKNASDFSETHGPFMQFKRAHQACDHYWKNYEQYKLDIYAPDDLINHPDFIQFK